MLIRGYFSPRKQMDVFLHEIIPGLATNTKEFVGLRQRWYTNDDLDSGETRPVHPFSIDIARF